MGQERQEHGLRGALGDQPYRSVLDSGLPDLSHNSHPSGPLIRDSSDRRLNTNPKAKCTQVRRERQRPWSGPAPRLLNLPPQSPGPVTLLPPPRLHELSPTRNAFPSLGPAPAKLLLPGPRPVP